MSTRAWTEDLSPELRLALKDLHRIEPARSLAKLAQLLAIWVLAAVLAALAPSRWAAAPCYLLMGFTFHSLGVLAHEGAHGTLLGRGWLDRLVGTLCGLPAAFPCNNYRATHLLHHRYENTELDPDSLEANCPNPVVRKIVYYGFYAVGTYFYVLQLLATGPFRARGMGNRLICLVETAFLLLFYGTVVPALWHSAGWELALRCWLLGIPCAALIANVRGLAEHTQLPHGRPPDSLVSTRTTLTSPVVSFFFNNQNYHLEHHLFPLVPWYHLPQLHELLKPLYQDRNASISAEGYLKGFRDGLRFGPLAAFRYVDERAIPVPRPTD